MKLLDFPLLTDENIDPDLVAYLRLVGFDVLDIKESGMQATADDSIIRLGNQTGRVVLTEDRDFCRIIFTQNPEFTGVVYFRPGSFFSAYHIATMEGLLKINPDLEPPFFITAERLNNKLRVKVRNALPGPS
jgi:predicted nuclease of predicted toxin-antitoxin system